MPTYSSQRCSPKGEPGPAASGLAGGCLRTRRVARTACGARACPRVPEARPPDPARRCRRVRGVDRTLGHPRGRPRVGERVHLCRDHGRRGVGGPFLVARSLFASSAIRETAAGTPAEVAVRREVEAISGVDERGFETLSPDAKLSPRSPGARAVRRRRGAARVRGPGRPCARRCPGSERRRAGAPHRARCRRRR